MHLKPQQLLIEKQSQIVVAREKEIDVQATDLHNQKAEAAALKISLEEYKDKESDRVDASQAAYLWSHAFNEKLAGRLLQVIQFGADVTIMQLKEGDYLEVSTTQTSVKMQQIASELLDEFMKVFE